ncbi:BglG family transcription antiterminator [Enterococcus hulanensis]|uniref:Ascorbate-specific PTS system EIIA component n=1 Tax=Enterococcus hulanensis TaxID=2559929 RepID=A0ABU3F5H4_9ENTE|nr:BglG family transcription antiterminator [Enterococcus hulanensis]MDT2602378.1 BglG family transcription antiterminator [Enterococcus hulanensis]MDT2611817.1 BglG family transcription antiterminator [Enterococcus hulanensis]MDT2618947.1 BglG family transcription antiterminator [Enterococcus hulanensis]MDT2630450.1 BglG family transcription antiterminator [Enterococcus hulanensis]MDT2657936.1 BglG family transcription antiterminator [Enterococcus hulanensis]
MNLEERTNQIFVELVNNPQIASKALCEKFDLTRGQLNYALKKINDSLVDEKLSEIKRTKNGHFLIANEILSNFKGGDEQLGEPTESYVFSGKERAVIIELMLLSKEEYLSLNHFIDELKVSRNTVLRDLKEVDQELQQHELALKYTRQKGYFIHGDEWNKRNLLSDLLNNLAVMYNGINVIIQFANIDPQQIETFRKRVELVEEELEVQFTDERLKTLPLLIILMIRRAQKGKLISYSFKVNYRELADTKEYLAADRVIWDVDGLSENERVYVTMLLLTTNLSRGDILSVKEINKMKEALEKVIANFERIAGVNLEEKEKLLERLLVHMRPAYYRIKYHLNLQTRFYQENKDANLFSLFYLVKEASGPLETYFGQSVPDAELFFISLFIGSHIVESTEIVHPENRKRAIIVCPNGISIAALLENTLKNLLPEIDFVLSMSAREFYRTDYDVDFIFSAVPLKTEKKVFVVNNFLSDQEKRQLRERVLRSTAIIQTEIVTPEKILAVVKKHAQVVDETSLYEELLSLFTPKESIILEKKRPHLIDLLKDETIQIFEDKVSWSEVLDALARPLERQQVITTDYIKALKKEMPILPAYTVLRHKIALPHTVAEAGAIGVGISLGLVKKGIITEDGRKIHTVILLGSNDKEEHLDLIFEMMSLAGADELAQLEKAATKEEIREALIHFNDEYWRAK